MKIFRSKIKQMRFSLSYFSPVLYSIEKPVIGFACVNQMSGFYMECSTGLKLLCFHVKLQFFKKWIDTWKLFLLDKELKPEAAVRRCFSK